mmetsp:Transcript_64968/g.174664  ORF Transcript_64968/g.174664 Transcript_64968/m.174664 type:complete len:435 (+) Transcript_64968:82-1386(+)
MLPMTFKFLANKGLVAPLTENATHMGLVANGSFFVTEDGDFYPGTSSRCASVSASDPDAMVAAMKSVTTIVSESGACVVDHGRELRFTAIMPSKSVSALIGVAGANVKQLQQATGSHIHVDSTALGFGPGGDRVVHVHGSAQSIEKAVEKLVGLMTEFIDQPWFPKWAERTNEERLGALEAPPLPGQEMKAREDRGSKSGNVGNADMGSMMEGMMGQMGMGMMNPMAMMGMMNPMMNQMGMMNPMAMMGCGGMCDMGMTGMGGMSGGGGAMCSGGGAMGSPSRGGFGGGGGPDLVMRAVQEMPPEMAADPRGFLLRCAVPTSLAIALAGPNGSGLQEVSQFTGTCITIAEGGEPTRILHVEGQLLNVCAAYMLMMTRYIQVEAKAKNGPAEGNGMGTGMGAAMGAAMGAGMGACNNMGCGMGAGMGGCSFGGMC